MVRNELEILWEEKGRNLETLQHLFWEQLSAEMSLLKYMVPFAKDWQ